MSGNSREHRPEKGFWNGGPNQKESAGQMSGTPGRQGPKKFGVRIDLERPAATPEAPSATDEK